MARKKYSEEFRRYVVELYRVTQGATVAQIASDLGIAHGSLSAWLRAAGVAIRRRGHNEAPPGPAETPDLSWVKPLSPLGGDMRLVALSPRRERCMLKLSELTSSPTSPRAVARMSALHHR